MKGVTILNSMEVVAETGHIWDIKCTISLIVLILGIISLVIIIHSIKKYDDVEESCWWCRTPVIILVATMISIGFTSTACFYLQDKPTAYKTQYQVSVDDSVTMNEFTEKYNIISIDGKIYTVEERN